MEQQISDLVTQGFVTRFAPEKTAITRRGPSIPAQVALAKVDVSGMQILDFGCGKAADAQWLARRGANCYVYDLFHALLEPKKDALESESPLRISPRNPQGLFDMILCVFVLNVVLERERQAIAECLLQLVKPKGLIIVGVREDTGAIRPTWTPFDDGYITPKGTFQTFFPPNVTARVQRLRNIFANCYVDYKSRGTWIIRNN